MIDVNGINDRFENCSTAIRNGRVQRRSNRFFERFIRILFRKIDFDAASIATLRELEGKGRVVYASFQSSAMSLLILTALLRRHGIKIPMLALGVTPYLYQEISNMVRLVMRSVRRLFRGRRRGIVSDHDSISGILDDHESIVVSLLSSRIFLMRYLEKKRDPLQDIIEIQMKSEESIFLVPELIFWNMNPERTRSYLTSQATGDRGLFSALFVTLKSVTPPSVRISSPIDLKKIIEENPGDSPELLAEKTRLFLYEMFNREKRSALGPIIKTGQEMMESVLYHPDIINTIQRLSDEQKKSVRKLRRMAYRYHRGIAADFSIVVVKYFQKFMMWVFHRVFDGIYYDKTDFKKVREASQQAPLIILPCHRSHMDYLIISSLFYENRLIPPHILAGDNLSFFPMGLIFRKSGAFFMKRSTRGLELYTAVLRQYIKTLVHEGYGIEFFIEGGRTRTGKTMHPKLGMLKYLIEAVNEGYSDDMMLLPVGINYDRVLEEKSFQGELHGKTKKSESGRDIVKSGKFLKGGYGGVHLVFGDPMSFRELRENMGEGDELVKAVADRIVKKISDAVMVTPFALVTSALLASSAKAFALSELRGKTALFMKYLRTTGASLGETLKDESVHNDVIDDVIKRFEHDGIVSPLDLGGGRGKSADAADEYFTLREEQRTRINFYKNNIIHYFLPVSFYSSSLLSALDGGLTADAKRVRDLFSRMKELFAREFVYPDSMDDCAAAVDVVETFLEEQSIINRDEGTVSVPPERVEDLLSFARLVQDVLEAYSVTAGTLASDFGSRIMKHEFIGEVRKNGVRSFHLGEIFLFEALSLPYYHAALAKIIDLKILRERKGDGKETELVLENKKAALELVVELRGSLKALDDATRTGRMHTRLPEALERIDRTETIEPIH